MSAPEAAAVTLAILAGGQGRRMGRDKALLVVGGGGVTLLGRVARAGREAGLPVLVVGRARPAGWDGPAEAAFIPDEVPGQGPLGGIAAALRSVRDEGGAVLAVGCDMPCLDVRALRFLLDAWPGKGRAHGLVAQHDGPRLEPLFSIYTAAALPLADARLAAGRRSLWGLIEAGDFGRVEVPADIAPALRNVNTQEDLVDLDLW
jgi:molybdopterin-guanine dinucleotide biosynthesis protein A